MIALEMIDNFILYLPVVVAFAIFSGVKRYSFKVTAATLLVGWGAYFGITLSYGHAWYIPVLQLVTGLAMGIIVLGVLGKKAAGETMGILLALFTLFPLVASLPWLSLGVAIALGLGATVAIGFKRWKAYEAAIKGGDPTTVRDLLWQSGVESGLASKSLPTAENLPDRRVLPKQARVSAAPQFLFGILVAVITTTLVASL